MSEQLVRMGRTDLWRRGDTELKDGRIVANADAKPVTVLTTTLDERDGYKPCAYQWNRAIYLVYRDGTYMAGILHDNDLVELSPEPRIVPWEFHEVPVNHRFRMKGSNFTAAIQETDATDATFVLEEEWRETWELLDRYEHSESHCGPWLQCGKVV